MRIGSASGYPGAKNPTGKKRTQPMGRGIALVAMRGGDAYLSADLGFKGTTGTPKQKRKAAMAQAMKQEMDGALEQMAA